MAPSVSSGASPPPRDWWWIFDPRLSLRARIAGATAATLALATLGLTWLVGARVTRTVETEAARYFETAATQVSDKLDRTLAERLRELQLLADLPAVRAAAGGSGDAGRVLRDLHAARADFGWIGLARPDGQLAGATAELSDLRPGAEPFWFRLAQGESHVGGLRPLPELAATLSGTDNDSPHFFLLAVPVTPTDGSGRGVLAAWLRWDWAREAQLSVVAEPALRQRISVTVYTATGEIALDSGNSGWSRPPAPPVLPDAWRFRGALREPTPEGTAFFTGYARSRGYREFRNPGWLTVVRQPLDRVFAPVAELRRALFGWGVLFTVAGTLLAWIAGGRLARRLHAVARSAERMREGDALATLPQAHSADEYGRMCRELGALVEELRRQEQPPRK